MDPQTKRAKLELNAAIARVGAQYRREAGLRMELRGKERDRDAAQETLRQLVLEKQSIRQQIAAVLPRMHGFALPEDVNFDDPEAIRSLLAQERDAVGGFVRAQEFAYAGAAGSDIPIVSSLLNASLGDRIERQQTLGTLRATRMQVIALAEVGGQLAGLWDQYNDINTRQADAQRSYEIASAQLAQVQGQQEQIQQIMAEVQSQVMELQGNLKRISLRIQRKEERRLIARGKLPPQNNMHTAADTPAHEEVEFRWPVEGVVSAGFLSQSYKQHYGVPHYGADLATPQGSPVQAAADGVVFTVRDGGAEGYSYVLVGHQGGFATLYGHLSEIVVQEGDDLFPGQLIGYSGGTPGSYGAGPMTSGPHLHFEVIKDGKHIDPLSVLP